MEGIKQAVEEMKLIKEGKLKATPAKELLDELWYCCYSQFQAGTEKTG